MDEQKILQRRRDHDENSTQQRAAILGLPYLDTRALEGQLPLVDDVMSVEEMYKGKVIPLQIGNDDRPFRFGATAQTPQSLIRNTTRQYNDDGKQVEFYLISNSGFRAFMQRYDPPKKVHFDDIVIANEDDNSAVAKVSQTLEAVGTEALFDYLIDQADKLGASDIHIENTRNEIRIRMRVDGALHTVAHLSRDRYRVIMGELARRASLSSAAKKPQSGHIQHDVKTDAGTHLLNMRIETVPTLYGQDAVLRLFNFDESLLNLDLLGIPKQQRKQVDEIISHPRGLVLMVGPTGSGKSTTLYSMLNALNTPDRKIITLEDPVEYGLSGVSQIPVDTTEGTSFADNLRSILRLDPDIVMVGEIRDRDTAKTAIQASITGHLVLSSFHANSTSAAFSRMIDLIGQNPIFSSSIRLVIAQRLVRRLYDESKQKYQPDESELRYVRSVLESLPDDYPDKPNLDSFSLYKSVPSDDAPFGYKGRMIIMEQMIVDEHIQKFIRGEVSDIHAEAIEKAARERGMITLEQSGVLAALRGETTLEEVSRVI